MSLHRSSQTLFTVGLIKLATPLPSQIEEAVMQSMLEELPGVTAVSFPADDQIEVRYNSGLTGERSFDQTVRRAGYVLADFGQRRNANSPMRHSGIRPLPPRL